jgi:predicted MFS family arabinose efflux permease
MGVNMEVFNLLMNLYLKELRFGEGDIGLVNASRAMGMALMAIPASALFARFHVKPLLIAGAIGFALFSIFLITTSELWLLLGFSLITGLSWSFFRVFSGPFFMRNSTSVERSHLFSVSYGVLLLSGMAGSAGAGALASAVGRVSGDVIFGYKCALAAGVLVGLAAIIPFGLIGAQPPCGSESRVSLTFEQIRRRGSFYLQLTLANFLIGIGAGLIIPFLNLYFKERFSLSPGKIGFFYLCVSASMFVGTMAGPVLARRFGLVRTVVFTQLASIPFMLTLAYSYFLPLAFVAFVIRGGLMNLNSPISSQLAMELSDEGEQPLVNALLVISWTASWMIAVAIGGELIERHGFTLVLNIASGLYVTASIMYYRFFRYVEQRRSSGVGWYIPDSGI